MLIFGKCSLSHSIAFARLVTVALLCPPFEMLTSCMLPDLPAPYSYFSTYWSTITVYNVAAVIYPFICNLFYCQHLATHPEGLFGTWRSAIPSPRKPQKVRWLTGKKTCFFGAEWTWFQIPAWKMNSGKLTSFSLNLLFYQVNIIQFSSHNCCES